MSSERVTVTISSSAGEDEPLTVADAMRQLLDFFELLTSAGGSDGQSISWQLIEISLNSPLSATAQAVSIVPGVLAEPIARREKAAVRYSIDQAAHSVRSANWTDARFRERAKRLYARNTSAIGRTSVTFEVDEPPLVINQTTARQVISNLDIFEQEQKKLAEDLSRTEYGSIEGVVISLTKHYNHPAIRVKERLTEEDILCIVPIDWPEAQGIHRNWYEAWADKRLLLTGSITYKADGRIQQMRLDDLEIVEAIPLIFKDIASPGLTKGLTPQQYIDAWWRPENG